MPKIIVTVGQQNKATVPKIFQTVAYLLCEILSKISHSLFLQKGNHSRPIDQDRKIIEVVRPFEPSSTAVHPCTSVEGASLFCGNIRRPSDEVTFYLTDFFFCVSVFA